MLLLATQNVVRRGLTAAFFIVGGANEVARVTFVDELGAEASSITGDIVEVRVDCGKNLATVWLSRSIRFDDDFADISAGRQSQRRTRGTLSSVHASAP